MISFLHRLEILEEQESLDAIFVAVGGGGLMAGVAAYIKSVNSKIKVSVDAKSFYSVNKTE